MTKNLAYQLQQAIRVERRHETQQRKQKFLVDGHVASQVKELSIGRVSIPQQCIAFSFNAKRRWKRRLLKTKSAY